MDEQVVHIAKRGDNIIQLENQVGNLLPKALYSDNVLDSVSYFTITQIAKELGITAQELNRSLCACLLYTSRAKENDSVPQFLSSSDFIKLKFRKENS